MDTHHLTPDTANAAHAAPSGPVAGRTESRAQWRLAMLEELAEIGMTVARAIGQQIAAAAEVARMNEPGAPPSEAIVKAEGALKSVSRTVRQTLAFHAKLEKQQRDEDGKGKNEKTESAFRAHRDDRSRQAKAGYHDRRKATVKRAVVKMLRITRDPSDAEDLLRDLREKLDELDDYADFTHDPVSALVAAVCRSMGLKPDWRLYADTLWAIEEMRTEPTGSPYANWPADERERGPP
jgi:hypothetical protein